MSEYKYAIGDKVRIATKEACKAWWAFNNKMEKYCDQVMTIREYSRETGEYYMEEDKGDWNNDKPGWIWSEQCIVGRVEDEMFNRDNLKTGDILVYANPHNRRKRYELIALGVGDDNTALRLPVDCDCARNSGFNWVSDITSDMQTPSGTIVEVLRPRCPGDTMREITERNYVSVWKREEKKKMTVAQLEEAMGMAPGTLSVVKES